MKSNFYMFLITRDSLELITETAPWNNNNTM